MPPELWMLDLFCGAGGAGAGYARAGFRVLGIDNKRQPHYPFDFIQADALEFARRWGSCFAAVHASPPCNDHSDLASIAGEHGTGHLLADTRTILARLERPYVIENVEGAAMVAPLTLCGTEFGLGVDGYSLRRHRLFESNVDLWGAGGCWCSGRKIIGVYGTGDGGTGRGWKGNIEQRRAAMGIDWMSRTELAQAIPPAYTEFIGGQLRPHCSTSRKLAV